MKLTFLLSALPVAFASESPIAGFTPQTSVTDHVSRQRFAKEFDNQT